MVKEERIHIFKKYYLIVAVKIKCKPKAVPACREASEPLFEEQSDAVKVSDTLCL
ncbi:MAG: hypothetical protein E6330_02540 [Dialister sp.]|nr:hypothetical protein [Dialister sp.]